MRAVVWILLAANACASAPRAPTYPSGDPLAGVKGEELAERARGYQKAGDFVRAEQYFQAAIERGYPERLALPGLIDSCLASARVPSALQHARAFVEHHPQDWAARYLMASLYHASDDEISARSELERVIGERPDQPAPRFLLAQVMDRLGDPTGAEAHLRRYLELAPAGAHVAEARARLAQARSGRSR